MAHAYIVANMKLGLFDKSKAGLAMNTTILNHPDFHALPKGVRQMLLASESYFFDQPMVRSQAAVPCANPALVVTPRRGVRGEALSTRLALACSPATGRLGEASLPSSFALLLRPSRHILAA